MGKFNLRLFPGDRGRRWDIRDNVVIEKKNLFGKDFSPAILKKAMSVSILLICWFAVLCGSFTSLHIWYVCLNTCGNKFCNIWLNSLEEFQEELMTFKQMESSVLVCQGYGLISSFYGAFPKSRSVWLKFSNSNFFSRIFRFFPLSKYLTVCI